MKKLIIIIFACIICTEISAKRYEIANTVDVMLYSKEQIRDLNQYIIRRLKRLKEHIYPGGYVVKDKLDRELYFYHISEYAYTTKFDKEDFNNGAYIKNLTPDNSSHRIREMGVRNSRYINSTVIVVDSTKVSYDVRRNRYITPTAITDNVVVSVYVLSYPYELIDFGGSRYDYLIQKKHELNIKYLFSITDVVPIFGLTEEGETYVFYSDRYGNQICPLKEFIKDEDNWRAISF